MGNAIMRRAAAENRERTKGLAALLLALALALRIVAAPAVMASPAPGVMAICSGGKIVYVSMETGLPVDEGDGPAATPCPFFNVMAALTVGDAPFVLPTPLVADRVVAAPLYVRPGLRPRTDARPRAPPAPV